MNLEWANFELNKMAQHRRGFKEGGVERAGKSLRNRFKEVGKESGHCRVFSITKANRVKKKVVYVIKQDRA